MFYSKFEEAVSKLIKIHNEQVKDCGRRIILNKMAQKECPIQPCTLIVGALFEPKQILIYFDTVKYIDFYNYKSI